MTYGRVFTDGNGDSMPQHKWTMTDGFGVDILELVGTESHWARVAGLWEDEAVRMGFRPSELSWMRDGVAVTGVAAVLA